MAAQSPLRTDRSTEIDRELGTAIEEAVGGPSGSDAEARVARLVTERTNLIASRNLK